MRIYCADLEADALLEDATKIWCGSFTEVDDKGKELRRWSDTAYPDLRNMFEDENNILIMHNGVDYDGPLAAKILGCEVKAEIIDTLWISWYLYPKNPKHGLQAWGEELGIAKPEIDDWENLSIEDYIHRCEEDVKIQVALWKMMLKHLRILYDNNEELVWKCIRHLNFKAKCVAMQSKSKWKLDVKAAEDLEVELDTKYKEAKSALADVMPDVPVFAKKSKPKKPFKMDGSLSATGNKWKLICEEHGVDFNYEGELKVQTGTKPANPGSHVQLKNWLFDMGWQPTIYIFDRDKKTNEVKKKPQLRNGDTGELCPNIQTLAREYPALLHLADMSVIQHRLGNVRGLLRDVDDKGYVKALAQGLTNTLRLKHKVCTNLPSTRKPYGAKIRGLFIARSEKTELCGSDACSLEDRTKQHYMWPHDPEYVKEMMQDDFDPHLDMAMAASLATLDDSNWYKQATEEDKHTERYAEISQGRHGGKQTNYAATYGATGPTIARSAGVSEALGEKLYNAYWERNWSLTAIADGCIVKQSRGLKWLWNPVAKMWYWLKAEKDRFSTLNQGTGTYAFDRWLYHVLRRRPQLTAQFHDEGIWELNKGNREAMTKILKDAIADVNDELKLNRDLDVDVQFGENYAEIH